MVVRLIEKGLLLGLGVLTLTRDKVVQTVNSLVEEGETGNPVSENITKNNILDFEGVVPFRERINELIMVIGRKLEEYPDLTEMVRNRREAYERSIDVFNEWLKDVIDAIPQKQSKEPSQEEEKSCSTCETCKHWNKYCKLASADICRNNNFYLWIPKESAKPDKIEPLNKNKIAPMVEEIARGIDDLIHAVNRLNGHGA